MTLDEAIADVAKNHEIAAWVYQVADDGTVVVGGADRDLAIAQARAVGCDGPIVHWDRGFASSPPSQTH